MTTSSTSNGPPAEDEQTAPPDQDIAHLSETLERLASWVRRVTPRGEFNLVSMATLVTIADEGPSRISDLAARERVSQPGMTGLVNRLADAGLVERRTDPSDGRASLVTATDAGLAHLHARHAARAQLLTTPLSRLSTTQRAALLAAMPALAALTTTEQPPVAHQASQPSETEDGQR